VHELAVDGDGCTEVAEVQQALRSVRARGKARAKARATAMRGIGMRTTQLHRGLPVSIPSDVSSSAAGSSFSSSLAS
jgi:hypothetical protein